MYEFVPAHLVSPAEDLDGSDGRGLRLGRPSAGQRPAPEPLFSSPGRLLRPTHAIAALPLCSKGAGFQRRLTALCPFPAVGLGLDLDLT